MAAGYELRIDMASSSRLSVIGEDEMMLIYGALKGCTKKVRCRESLLAAYLVTHALTEIEDNMYKGKFYVHWIFLRVKYITCNGIQLEIEIA